MANNKNMGYGYDSNAAEDEVRGQPYVDGFGISTILGGLFVAFIMLPGAIYLYLVAGQGMGAAAQWTTIILFSEIARRSFKTLKKQELYVLYCLLGGVIGAAGPFQALIWNQYIVQSYEAEAFGIADELNSPENHWIAPPKGSPALINRTFLDRAWLPALFVLVVSQLMGRIIRFTLGYALFRLTSDIERLPFPLAPIAAQGATALAETYEPGQRWRWRVFASGSALGLLFGAIYIVLPGLTGAVMNKPIQILPIPFIDLCTTFENILPASLVGISTDLGGVFIGFVLPFPLVLGGTVGSISANMIANPILHHYGVLKNWRYGMQSIPTSINNSLDFWLSFSIGTALVIASLGIVKAVSIFFKRRTAETASVSLGRLPEGRGDFPVWLALALWACATGVVVWLCHWCVPGFPWWIFAIFGFIWTPLNSYISARMIGLAAQSVPFPYLKEGSFILATNFLSYSGSAIWFAPIPLGDHGGMTQFFREMTLTRTKITSMIKVELTVFPIMLIAGIIFCGLLWKIAPIPSASYPFVAKMWPFEATFACLWATATKTGSSYILEAIRPQTIGMGYLFGLLLYSILGAVGAPPLFFYGAIGGLGSWPHAYVPQIIGALLGRYVFSKRFGQENWQKYTPVLAAGFFCGMGLTGMLSIGIAMVANSVIHLPY